MNSKKPSESRTVQTEIVFPNDTNNLNNLMGCRLLHWMDIAAAVCAQRHCGRTCVTAAVNNVSFGHPIPRASIVTLEANISRSFSKFNFGVNDDKKTPTDFTYSSKLSLNFPSEASLFILAL